MTRFVLVLSIASCLACAGDDVGPDSSMADAGVDAGPVDAPVDAGPPPEIEASYDDGTVVGRTIDGVHRFLGLPYAAPPVGDLRWQPPQAVAPWTTARDASELGSPCSQINALVSSTSVLSVAAHASPTPCRRREHHRLSIELDV